MNLLILCAIVIVLAWLYIWVARPWLASRYPKVWQWIDTAESWLIDRSRTLLIARLYWLGGIFIAVHDTLAEHGFDVTPLITQVSDFVPENYRPLALAGFLALTGIAFEWLRHVTREPLPGKVG
jgi:hypothetical protein